jgi:hypothetical protein
VIVISAISAISAGKDGSKAIFDLSGRKANASRKGIVVSDGKKMIRK